MNSNSFCSSWMADMEELKPCPFCGVKVSLTYHSADNTYNFWHKGVNSCAAKDPIEFDGDMVKSLKEASDAWNRRANDV